MTVTGVNDALDDGNISYTITVTSPNRGEYLSYGSPAQITWSSSGTSGTVEIYFRCSDNGPSWNLISTEMDDGLAIWNVMDVGYNCRIRVQDESNGSILDESNADFVMDF